jgi:integrase
MPCAVLLALDCDLDRRAIVTLRWADVDLVNHEVVVRPLDGQAARVVPMPPGLCEALQKYGGRERRDPIFFPSDSRETAVARIKDTFHRTAQRLGLWLAFDSLWLKFAVPTAGRAVDNHQPQAEQLTFSDLQRNRHVN